MFYNQGKYPTIVSGEGYVKAFCIGEYLTPGALYMNADAIKSAHVVQSSKNGKVIILTRLITKFLVKWIAVYWE